MRLFTWAAAAASVTALTVAAPAPASPTSVVRSTFEGRVATASWDACSLEGCFRTTATASVGTVTQDGVSTPASAASVTRSRYPTPLGVSQVITAAPDDAMPVVAEDLSSASWAGEALIYSQDCSDQGVCHGASFEPLGRAHVAASWTATGAPRRFHEHERRDVNRLTGEDCVYSTTSSGARRTADASLVFTDLPEQEGWLWPLGSLTSASISEVKSIFVRRCKSPF